MRLPIYTSLKGLIKIALINTKLTLKQVQIINKKYYNITLSLSRLSSLNLYANMMLIDEIEMLINVI